MPSDDSEMGAKQGRKRRAGKQWTAFVCLGDAALAAALDVTERSVARAAAEGRIHRLPENLWNVVRAARDWAENTHPLMQRHNTDRPWLAGDCPPEEWLPLLVERCRSLSGVVYEVVGDESELSNVGRG